MKTKLKNIITIFIAFASIHSIQSCSKKNDPVPDPVIPEQTLELEGKWAIESVNFLDETAAWDATVDYTSESGAGWAPGTYAHVKGMDFQTTALNNSNGQKLGNKYSPIVSEELSIDQKNTWYWNYSNDKQSFETKPLPDNSASFDYAFHDISSINLAKDGNKIIFKAKINSRKPGKAINETVQVPVEVTLLRGVPTTEAKIIQKGQTFVMPQVVLTEEENRAVLLEELKANFAFNASYVFKINMDFSSMFNATIEDFKWDNAIVQDVDRTEDKQLGIFVAVDKKGRLYFYVLKGNNDYNAVYYEKFKIEKVGTQYTLWGEHADGKGIVSRGDATTTNHTIRLKVTFDTATKETTAIPEIYNLSGQYTEMGFAYQWKKDANIKTQQFETGNNPFPNMEL